MSKFTEAMRSSATPSLKPTYSGALANLMIAGSKGWGPSGVEFTYEHGSLHSNAAGCQFKVADDEGNKYLVIVDAVELNRGKP